MLHIGCPPVQIVCPDNTGEMAAARHGLVSLLRTCCTLAPCVTPCKLGDGTLSLLLLVLVLPCRVFSGGRMLQQRVRRWSSCRRWQQAQARWRSCLKRWQQYQVASRSSSTAVQQQAAAAATRIAVVVVLLLLMPLLPARSLMLTAACWSEWLVRQHACCIWWSGAR